MINSAKGKAYWPTIKEHLRNTYKSCEVCLENAISKPAPHHKVIPSSLELLQPNKVVHIDYMEIRNTNIFILKCKSSGWTWAPIMKDKTAETTCQVFHKYITLYDRPRLVISDAGPAFLTMFLNFLSSHYINHRYSSYYRAKYNSPAERGVRSIKDVLQKIPSFNDKTVRTVVFGINQHVSPDGSGSPSERFFKGE